MRGWGTLIAPRIVDFASAPAARFVEAATAILRPTALVEH